MPQFAKGRYLVLVVLALALASLEIRETQAHKAVTSPYDYNKDIFPILRDRCGRCHVQDGPAPMSLLVYNDGPNGGLPWAESIREHLVSEQMPPWYVDPLGPAMKGGFPITSREVDKLVWWASGGTPQGELDKKPAPTFFHAQWKAGPPDLKIAMESEHKIAEAVGEETQDFVIPTGLVETRWVKAVDLLPGTPSVVRNAVISLENGPVLSVWVPGDDAIPAPSGAAFRLPADAKLHLQIHYKKQWFQESNVVADRSTVGIYFTDAPASGREIQALTIDGANAEASETRTFAGTVGSAARVVAVRPSLDQVYGTLDVHALTPSGRRVPLLLLRAPRPEWRRRYWLAEPIELPAGTKIEATVTPPPDYLDLTSARLVKGYPLQVALDFVPQ